MSKPEIRIWKEIFKNLAIIPEVVLLSKKCEKVVLLATNYQEVNKKMEIRNHSILACGL